MGTHVVPVYATAHNAAIIIPLHVPCAVYQRSAGSFACASSILLDFAKSFLKVGILSTVY